MAEGQRRVLKEREKVFLCVYRDGICVNGGPFRPYGWALCDAFLNDILEGYYPYEFKDRYPDGFPVQLVDRSMERCPTVGGGHQQQQKDKKGQGGNGSGASPATGGRRLGTSLEDNQPSNSGVSGNVATLDDQKRTEGTFKPMTREEFLKKLPERYVGPGGRLVNVRQGVEELVPAANPSGAGPTFRGGGHVLGGAPLSEVTAAAAAVEGGSNGGAPPTHHRAVVSNVEKLFQQAAENKRIDAEIAKRRKEEEEGLDEATAHSAVAGGRRSLGNKRAFNVFAVRGERAQSAPTTPRSGALQQPKTALFSTNNTAVRDFNPRADRVVSTHGEVVGTGGTAPANANFLQTIRGNTPAGAELASRGAAVAAAAAEAEAAAGAGGGTLPSPPVAPASAGRSRRRIVTVQIRMPQGQRCVLNMYASDTVADVRREFEAAVPDFFRGHPAVPQSDAPAVAFELSSAFPRRVCTDHAATLEELGMYPNATLMVRVIGAAPAMLSSPTE